MVAVSACVLIGCLYAQSIVKCFVYCIDLHINVVDVIFVYS